MLFWLYSCILLVNTSPYIYVSKGRGAGVGEILELAVGHSEHDAAGGEAAAAGRSGTCRARRARGECREALASRYRGSNDLALRALQVDGSFANLSKRRESVRSLSGEDPFPLYDLTD